MQLNLPSILTIINFLAAEDFGGLSMVCGIQNRALLALASISVFCNACTYASLKSPDESVAIFYITDYQGELLPYATSFLGRDVGGLEQIAGNLQQRRQFADSFGVRNISVAVGDSFFGSRWSKVTSGESAAGALSALGVDVVLPGNQSLILGVDQYRLLASLSGARSVLSNVRFSTDSELAYEEVVLVERGPITVAFIGVWPVETAEQLAILAPSVVVDEPVEKIRQLTRGTKADVVIVLSNCEEATDTDIASIPEVDLVINGKGRAPPGPLEIRPKVVSAASGGEYIGEAVLGRLPMYDGSRLYSVTHYRASGLPAGSNEDVSDYLKSQLGILAPKLQVPLVSTTKVWLASRDQIRTEPMPLGHAVAESMSFLGDDPQEIPSFVSSGSIRRGIGPGAVTTGDVFATLPFYDRAVLIEVRGSDIYSLLRQSLGKKGTGGYLQYAGIRTKIGVNGLECVTLSNGSTILDNDDKVLVVINDFVLLGGDGYTWETQPLELDVGKTVSELFVDYLSRKDHWEPNATSEIEEHADTC